jgi:acyl carrier protein
LRSGRFWPKVAAASLSEGYRLGDGQETSMLDVEPTVFDIIARMAKVESGTLNRATELTSLTLDSIDVVEIIFQIEEAFDISLPYNANQAASAAGAGLATVGDVIDLVTARIGSGDARQTQS